jgi:hypothetical protein
MARVGIQGGLLATPVQVALQKARLTHMWVFNSSNAVAYVQIFGALAAKVVAGTTAPDMSIGINTLVSTSVPLGTEGPYFGGGITAIATTTYNGSTPPNVGLQVQFGVE